jgi:hypothetical protein
MTLDELRAHLDELRARLERLRQRPLVDDSVPPMQWRGTPTAGRGARVWAVEMRTPKVMKELREQVAHAFHVLSSECGVDCDGHRQSALASDDQATEHLYKLVAAARGIAEKVGRQGRDTAR